MGIRGLVGLVPVMVLLVLWATSESCQVFLSSQLLGSSHFMFSVLNSILLLITMRNLDPPPPEDPHWDLLPSPQSLCDKLQHTEISDDEDEEDDENDNLNEQKGEEEEEEEDEDDDENDNLNEQEDEDEDEDEDDENESEKLGEEEEEELERRIEEFIAKVNERWREEKLRDKLQIQICSSVN